MRSLAALLPFLAPYRRRMSLGILAVLGTASIGLLAPLIIGRAIDVLSGEVTRASLLRYAGLLLLVTLVQGIFQFAQRRVLVAVSRDVEHDLRVAYLSRLSRMEPAFFHDHPTGDLMARATNDLQAIRMVCGPAIMYSANTLFVATGALVLMLGIHTRLTLIALAPLPLVAIVTKVFGERIHVLFERVQESFSDLSTRVQENLSGARVVRAYVQEAAEEAAFDGVNRENLERNRDLIRWSAAFHPLLQGLIGLGFAVVLFSGGRLLVGGEITVGEFVTFQLYLGKMVWPMIAIGWVINLTQRAAASMGRVSAILEREPGIADAPRPGARRPDEVYGHLRFRGLDFAHRTGGPEVLKGVDLDVPAGRTVGIVGRTGSGKSTLLSLIPRWIDPPVGTLFLDGTDVREVPLAVLRGALAMVPQESFLFSATLRENVAFGRPDVDDATLRRAVALAGLDRDLEGFPAGLETRVGERGITLSGGQKQRVALARALVRDPSILLLDDCLSAVDAETEEHILGNLRTVFPGRTVLLVSHRITAVAPCDEIVVLDEGRIVERGRHEELLSLGGIYADLRERQRIEEALQAV